MSKHVVFDGGRFPKTFIVFLLDYEMVRLME